LVLTKFGLAKDELSSRSLEVSPPSQEINADPGSEVVVVAKIRNKSKEKIDHRG